MKLSPKISTALSLALLILSCSKKGEAPQAPFATTTVFAGSGTVGSADGKGAAASFYFPSGAAVDAAGNIYISDTGDDLIRKITPAGQVTTIAGNGYSGASNNPGRESSFDYPYGIAVDASGNIYVADSGNNLIRKITPSGTVSTLAGSGATGAADGQGTTASFNFPMAVAVDVAGNVYVADQAQIRKITPAGLVSTLAGTGTPGDMVGAGSAAAFAHPKGLALDAAGNIFVVDSDNNKIKKVTPAGVVTTIAGDGTQGYADGTGTAATFGNPYGIAIDAAGNLYITDATNYTIRKITPAGVVTTMAGSGFPGNYNGIGDKASFGLPEGIAVDKSDNIYVADFNNQTIRKVIGALGH